MLYDGKAAAMAAVRVTCCGKAVIVLDKNNPVIGDHACREPPESNEKKFDQALLNYRDAPTFLYTVFKIFLNWKGEVITQQCLLFFVCHFPMNGFKSHIKLT